MGRGQHGPALREERRPDTTLDEDLSAAIRASFLLAGPLLARFGTVHMPPPGGDFIGRRRLDAHLDAFRELGARVGGQRWIELNAPPGGLRAAEIFMDEPSVMGTENALMAAALTPGETTILNAASEPHVQDLARLLVKMGAPISGIGSNVMIVQRPGQAGRGRPHGHARPHRDRQLHGPRRRDRRRAPHPRDRTVRPDHDPPAVPPPRLPVGGRRHAT